MDKAIFIPNSELSTIWLQRSILKHHIRENRSTCSLLPWSYSSWLHNTLLSQRPKLMTHSINALLEIGLTYSGELTAKTSQVVRATSRMSLRSFLRACFRLSHPTDHQCLRSWPIPGCKKKLQLYRRSKQDSSKGIPRSEKLWMKKDRPK